MLVTFDRTHGAHEAWRAFMSFYSFPEEDDFWQVFDLLELDLTLLQYSGVDISKYDLMPQHFGCLDAFL